MKKTHLISSVLTIVTIFACKDNKERNTDKEIEIINANRDESNKELSNKKTIKKFSWDNIPESATEIGDYPYITPPKGMIVDENTSNTVSYDFHKLEMFDGKSFFDIEGQVDKIGIIMDGDKNWNQYYFDKSIEDYMNSIGAQLIFKGKIPDELIDKKGKTTNERYAYCNNFYIGDIVNETIRMFVLKTPTKKIGIQVYSNTATAQIGIVESKEFEQTIEKITANDILKEITNKGFATLHINFDTGKSRIKTDSYEIIAEISKMMKSNPELKISIEGHTDNVGDEASNMKLSKNRAQSVLIALTDENIDEDRLKSKGFGQTKPLESNSTEEGKAKNRRVELRKI